MTTLVYKILKEHLVTGNLTPGEEIEIRIDQTLTQDSTGTMVYLQLEAMDAGAVKTEVSVAYVDHNTLQTGFENADDHAFIKSVAARHGVLFSKPGGGICHQLHLENFGAPGKTLLGSDSHTPTGGGLGMLAIGAGGLDVAIAMAQGIYSLPVPKVLGVELKGELKPWVSAKDVILHILKELTVKGGVGYAVEYFGEGVSTLSVTDRATITNMGAELGATTSVFPSDERTREYLATQGREDVYKPLSADEGAVYDKTITVNLSEITPLAACPHSPDAVAKVSTLGNIAIDQVCVGSCTNSSYADLMKTAAILKGRKIADNVSFVVSPGSAAILSALAKNGALAALIDAGARVIENACGPCIGMGQSPKSGAVSLRTFNRNFKGRSGTNDASVYLVSPETAAISAITGKLTDGLKEHAALGIELPEIAPPTKELLGSAEAFLVCPPQNLGTNPPPVAMGPNIKPFPRGEALSKDGAPLTGEVVLLAGDNITTDDIMPSDSRLLPYRSNVPHLSNYCFEKIDAEFPARARAAKESALKGGIIVGGENYGQGSSREHAALAPLSLGIRAVLAKSFARIHRANLINSGILPLTFIDPQDAAKISLGDALYIESPREQLQNAEILVQNKTQNQTYRLTNALSDKEKLVVLAGGKINLIRGE